jgi:hypothetical protein
MTPDHTTVRTITSERNGQSVDPSHLVLALKNALRMRNNCHAMGNKYLPVCDTMDLVSSMDSKNCITPDTDNNSER